MVILQFLAAVGLMIGCWYFVRKEAMKKGMPRWIGHFAGAASGVFIFLVVIAATQSEKKNSDPLLAAEKNKKDIETDQVIVACEKAHEAVEARLKAPSTAKFPGCVFGAYEHEIRANEQRTVWFVKGHVDSQNSFGAMLRTEWAVKLNRSADEQGNDRWTIVSVATAQK